MLSADVWGRSKTYWKHLKMVKKARQKSNLTLPLLRRLLFTTVFSSSLNDSFHFYIFLTYSSFKWYVSWWAFFRSYVFVHFNFNGNNNSLCMLEIFIISFYFVVWKMLSSTNLTSNIAGRSFQSCRTKKNLATWWLVNFLIL